MKVLFITIAWPSTGERNIYTDLMDEFTLNSHDVFVATAGDTEIKTDADLRQENGIRVLRIRTGKIRKAAHLRKALSLLTLSSNMFNAINKHYTGIRFDLIISTTPPVTLSALFRRLKRLHGARFYLLLKDMWPQGSVDLKVFPKYSLPWMYLRWHEISTYKTADHIGTMSPMNVEYLLSKNRKLPSSKVEVCPNSLRPSRSINSANQHLARQKFGIPPDACVFIFSGNLGRGHGLSFLIEAVKKLADYPKAFFVIGGSGTHLNFLKESIGNSDFNNVFLYSWLPRNDFDLVLKISDVGLIFLDKRYTTPQFPSRLLSYLDAGKPVLCAINKGTDIGTIVENSGSGKSVIHGDLESFVSEVIFFSENEKARFRMGENAHKLLMEEYTAAKGYKIISRHFINRLL